MTGRGTVVFLLLSGALLLVIGGGVLLVPQAFHASNGIVIADDASLLSEIRAPGGLLTASALFILAGAFRRSWRRGALLLSVTVYGSYGLARVAGMALDGIPARGLIVATVIELIVAAVGLALLSRSPYEASSRAMASRRASCAPSRSGTA